MTFLKRRLRPSFIIIGAQKAGTTNLYHHLALHPELVPSKTKEISFFNKPAIYNRGLDWYHQQFPMAPIWSSKRAFEATPVYLYHPGTAERIAKYSPKIKMIAILRDPVSRAYSAWNMYRQIRANNWHVILERLETQTEKVRNEMIAFCDALETTDFTTTVRQFIANDGQNPLEPGLLERGLYARQLEEYYRHFPKEQILVFESAACRANLSGELDRVADFLGIQRVEWEKLPVAEENFHRRKYEEKMPEEAGVLLKEYFRKPNEDLFALLGTRYAWNE